jgi:multiple sugar transport system substrate-binding protein
MMTIKLGTAPKLCALALAGTIALSGCSAGSDETAGPNEAPEEVTQEQIDEAMSTPTTLELWAWVPGIEDNVALFEEKYPEIDVELINQGGSPEQYVKLRAVFKAGRDVPDVAQIGYDFLPSFTQTGDLLDLAPYGAAELEADFLPGVWSQVAADDAVWALPQDSGPMGNLYRTDLFEQAGVAAPATWEDFATAAEAVKSSTGAYITNLPGNDMGQMFGLFQQAGAAPFAYDGKETVSVNLDSPETQAVAAYWQDLIDRDLVATDPDFTDGWYQGLARGKYASWLSAAWGPTFLQGTAQETSGKWAAAELPQWNAGDSISGNWGGSSLAVPKLSENPIAAYELAKFINTDPESASQLANELFLFPTTEATLADPKFTDQKADFYGGQQVNKLFAEISGTVPEGSGWVPFMDYVQTAYNETFGKAIADHGDLEAALTEWQNAVADYAAQQGFTVE